MMILLHKRQLMALALGLFTLLWMSSQDGRFSWLSSAHAQAEHAPHEGHDEHEGHDHAEHEEAEGDHEEHEEAEGEHEEHEGHEDEDAHEDEEGVIRISPTVLREFDIELKKAAPGVLGAELRLPGQIVVNPDLVAHVVPRASGIVQSVAKRSGDSVTRGEVLAVLDSPALSQAKVEFLSLRQELELHELDLERARTIHENSVKALTLLKENPLLEELAELEGLDLGGMRRELIGSYASMAAAQSTLDRKRQLHTQQIASDAELQEAESAFKQARVEYLAARDAIGYANERALIAAQREVKLSRIRVNAAEQNLHALGLSEEDVAAVAEEKDATLSRLEMVAPLDGVVTERHLVRGEKASDEETAFVIADYSSVWIHLTLYPRDFGLVAKGMPVTITLSGTAVTGAGEVDLVSPEVDAATRTATVRVVLENADGHWRPGAFVTGHIAVSSREAAVVVPADAVILIDGAMMVFVQTAEGLEPRPVRIGERDHRQVEILEGLAPGELFAAGNVLPLKAELNRAALEHAGHAH